MGILTKREVFKPFEYPTCFEYMTNQQKAHWLPTEVPMTDDVYDFNKKLTPSEKNLIIQILRFFTTGDQSVMDNYNTSLIKNFPKPEIAMMLTAFANAEVLHTWAYSQLNDTLGLPDSEYAAFRNYSAMRDKFDLMHLNSLEDGTRINIAPTPRQLAKNLAVFGGFIEGVSLFASFAVLMNFPRRGLMKGVGQIVTWSVRDENCFDDKTEVLTENGWKLFRDVSFGERVAQMDLATKGISFAVPSNYIEKDFDGELVYMRDGKARLNIACTEDHDLLFNYKYNPTDTLEGYKFSNMQKVKAKDLAKIKSSNRYVYPLAGRGVGAETLLTPLERLRIAIQADGCLDLRPKNLGERTGGTSVNVPVKKDRKKERMEKLLLEAGIQYTVGRDKEGYARYHFILPIISRDKSLSWIDLQSLSSAKAKDIISEIGHWDGHDRYKDGSFIDYVTTCEVSRDKVQAVAILAGYLCTVQERPDNRSEKFNTSYKVSINKKLSEGKWRAVNQERRKYKGKVYCFTMPEGSLVVRRGLKHAIVGNCHADGVSYLFRELAKEHKLLTPDFKKEIYDACEEIVRLEDNFIDTCFEMGAVDGLTPEDLKKYIRYIANYRLKNLGLKAIFKGIKENPLDWMDLMMSGKEHANFFEARATEYSKGDTNWGDF
jgi:ribonucleotide reductase beta subunit family protein with ferritin-like domain